MIRCQVVFDARDQLGRVLFFPVCPEINDTIRILDSTGRVTGTAKVIAREITGTTSWLGPQRNCRTDSSGRKQCGSATPTVRLIVVANEHTTGSGDN